MSGVTLDGAEGGGQILRNAFAYSALLGTPVTVHNIRGSRNPPGLKNQHLAGVQLCHTMSGGDLSGASLGSTETTLTPATLLGGNVTADAITAGSCTLLTQTAFPLLLFAPSENTTNSFTALGGTDVGMSPPLDYLRYVFLPHAARFGADAKITRCKRGVFPRGGGTMVMEVTAMAGSALTPVTLVTAGEVVAVKGYCFVTQGPNAAEEAAHLKQNVLRALSEVYKGVEVEVEVAVEAAQTAKNASGAAVVLTATTDSGCLLGGIAVREKRGTLEGITAQAVKALKEQTERKVCVDEWMQDQLVILAALAEGQSRYLCGPITEHTQCAMQVAEQMTKCTFSIDALPNGNNIVSCNGVGYKR